MDPPPPSSQQAEAKRKEFEEQRSSILLKILDPGARVRLARICLLKPEKARYIEDYLIELATSGRVKQIINESLLISLLEQMSEREKTQSTPRITVKRRDVSDEDDDYEQQLRDLDPNASDDSE